MPKPEYEFFPHENIPWEPLEVPGMYQKILSKDPDSGDYTRMLRFDPGVDSSALGTQYHDFWEEVYILQGDMFDIPLNQNFTAGMYACRPPGMPHGPWRSKEGCMTVEMRYYKK